MLASIALNLDIYEASLAVKTTQMCFQHEHSEETEQFSSSGPKWDKPNTKISD